MGIETIANQPPGKAIYELVIEARRRTDSRAEVRFPFFRGVSIGVGGARYAAFSREISESGIGLLHKVELAPGEIDVDVRTEQGGEVRLRVQIVWCEPCGHGWYISGAQFVGNAA